MIDSARAPVGDTNALPRVPAMMRPAVVPRRFRAPHRGLGVWRHPARLRPDRRQPRSSSSRGMRRAASVVALRPAPRRCPAAAAHDRVRVARGPVLDVDRRGSTSSRSRPSRARAARLASSSTPARCSRCRCSSVLVASPDRVYLRSSARSLFLGSRSSSSLELRVVHARVPDLRTTPAAAECPRRRRPFRSCSSSSTSCRAAHS